MTFVAILRIKFSSYWGLTSTGRWWRKWATHLLCKQSLEWYRDQVPQDRKNVFGGYLHILKTETVLLSPSDPPSDQVSPHKSTSSSASADWKNSTSAGFVLLIWHWFEDPQGYQEPGHSRSTSLVPWRRGVLTKWGDPRRSGSSKIPRKKMDHEVWWISNDNFKWPRSSVKLRRQGHRTILARVPILK